MRRHEARQRALQALFACDVGKGDPLASIAHVLEDDGRASEVDTAYITRLVTGTVSLLPTIDQRLADEVEGWKLDRIGKVELNVLRLALYELMNEHDVDFATVADEAVALTKSFSNEAASKFVNGVLAKLGHQQSEPRA